MLKGLKRTKYTWAQKKTYYLSLFNHRTSYVQEKKKKAKKKKKKKSCFQKRLKDLEVKMLNR